MLSNLKKRYIIAPLCLAGIACGVVVLSRFSGVYSNVEYVNPENQVATATNPQAQAVAGTSVAIATGPGTLTLSEGVVHIKTPESVKAIYLSSWVAGSTKHRTPLIKLIDDTELNAVIIDVKDSTGRISFPVNDPVLASFGSVEKRIADIDTLIKILHQKNIYVIARVAVFQDPYMTGKKPEWAVRKKSDGGVWKDRKGLSFLDPTKKEVWDYTIRIANEAYARGFDEINFDYIRYPSDGNMKDINYNLEPGKTRADNVESFFIYLAQQMKKDTNIPISGDLFGLTTEVLDDMGIGQVWEKALPHFDFLAPMIYPSHYPSGHAGYKNPATSPYMIIDRALEHAVVRTRKTGTSIAKIRPWLQDFDMGATYTKELVRAQMKATYDNGITSWMLWDPSNKYTPSALLVETTQ